MQIEELVPGINLEDYNNEFKGIIEEGKKEDGSLKEIGWLKTLAAFANTDGGNMYIGVNDKSHQVMTLDHSSADKIVRMVHRQIREKLQPAIHCNISSIPVPGSLPIRYVLKITVSKSQDLPVTLHEKGLLGIYVRNFGQTETASPEQIRDMVLMSENLPYDRPFTDEVFDKEHFHFMFQLLHRRNIQITEKQLISIGFMDDQKRLSKGAVLFEDSCNDSSTRISMTLWPEYSKGSDIVLANEVYTGNLLEGISRCEAFVASHSANGYRKENDRHVSFIAYPPRSVTEGIVSAVAHRNYYIQGAQIEINIFRDRLEITSPGSLLGVRRLVKEKNIASIIPRRRNEVICDILSMCQYMEEKGCGFDKIEEDYASADGNHLPYISADSSSFTLTLPDLTFQAGVAASESAALPDVYCEQILTGKNDQRILSYCYNEPRKASEIADFLGISPSTYFRKNTLSRLVKDGLLRETKEGRTSMYFSNRNVVKRK